MVQKDKCLLLDAVAAPLIYHSCQQSAENWSEIKRNSEGGEAEGDGADLACFWLNSAQTVARYTWVPLFIWIRILPLNIKHQKPDKPASSVSEIRWSSFRCSFFTKVLAFWAAVPSHMIICTHREKRGNSSSATTSRSQRWWQIPERVSVKAFWVLRLLKQHLHSMQHQRYSARSFIFSFL